MAYWKVCGLWPQIYQAGFKFHCIPFGEQKLVNKLLKLSEPQSSRLYNWNNSDVHRNGCAVCRPNTKGKIGISGL